MAEGTSGAPGSDPELGPEDAAYLDRVRRATEELGVRELAPDDVAGNLAAMREMSRFDVDAPVASHRANVQLVKTGLKRALTWYFRYLSGQLEAFAATAVRTGEAVASRTERLESELAGLASRLEAAEQRLRRIEEGEVGPAGAAPDDGIGGDR